MIQGDIRTLPLPDLIQWLALTHRTGKLVLRQDTHNLEFYFAKGEIAAAATSDLAVLDTAEKVCSVLGFVLTWRAGRFAFEDGSLPGWVMSVNLRLSAEAILYQITSPLKQRKEPKTETGLEKWAEASMSSGLFTQTDALRLQVVDHLLKEDFSVPAMPQLAARVLELTHDKNFSLRELGNLVLTDQAVAARVLRYANSIAQGAEREVDSLAVAVQRLGADEIVNIVLAASLQTRRLGRDPFAAEKQRLWVRSSVTAFLARLLAARVGLERNLGFLCGLLMDFGMTVLYSVIQDVLAQRATAGQIPVQVAKEIVRDFHPRVGRVVGEKWRLPTKVIEAMAYHHCLNEAPSDNPYVAITALADFLAHFALGVKRAALEVSLASLSPEQLAAHPAAQLINLSAREAAIVLVDLPLNLDQALNFVFE